MFHDRLATKEVASTYFTYGRLGDWHSQGSSNVRKIHVIASKALTGRCVSRSFREKRVCEHVFYAHLGVSAESLALPGEQTGWEANMYDSLPKQCLGGHDVEILCQSSAREAVM